MVFHTDYEDYCYLLTDLKLIADKQDQEAFHEDRL